MLRTLTSKLRIKSPNSANPLRFYNYNHIQYCTKLFSTSKIQKSLLDDTEELDPELIESCYCCF